MSLFQTQTSGGRNKLKSATTVERLFDEMHSKMKSPTTFSDFARSAGRVFERLEASKREALGYDEFEEPIDNAERAVERLRENGNLFVVFEGSTPAEESRDWVRGSTELALKGVAFVFTEPPILEEEELVYLVPGQEPRAWDATRVPGQLFSIEGLCPERPATKEEQSEAPTSSEAAQAELEAAKADVKATENEEDEETADDDEE